MGICNQKFFGHSSEDCLSVDEYDQIPLVSLEQAVDPLISFIPTIETYVSRVKEKCRDPADGLTSDESASIMLYSMVWQPIDRCLYRRLNEQLSSLNHQHLKPWFPFLKLLFSALLRLPSINQIVYRGSPSNLSPLYAPHEIMVWSDLPLCTSSKEYLQSDACLGQTPNQSIITIHGMTIKNIYQHTFYPSNTLVVFLPGTKFQVIESVEQSADLHLITLQEIRPSFLLSLSSSSPTNGVPQKSFPSTLLNKSNVRMNVFKLRKSHKSAENFSLEQRIDEHTESWIINLDKQNLTDQDMLTVVKHAINRNHCKRIRLRDNQITPDGISVLAEGLLNNSTLESLDLCNNQIADTGVKWLTYSITRSNIKTLNLESNGITSESGIYLAQMLRESQSLSELYLSKNHLGDRGIEFIAKGLIDGNISTPHSSYQNLCEKNASILQHLYLGQNQITDDGIEYLSEMLKSNRILTWLWLTGNEISNRGVECLANVLADSNNTLEWLFLNSNPLITDASVDVLLQMLQRNNSLKTLYINNCSLSEQARRKFSKIIKIKKDFDLEV